MAMDDLFQALNMFKAGVQDLQTSRVIQGANEQVQQIKASEASEADKRNALTALSQNLVGQLGALGAPVSDIAQQAANIAPKQYANANQMYSDALLNNKPELMGEAQKQQGFENNKAFTLAMIKAQAKADPIRQMQFQALQDERFTKHIENFDKSIDTQTTRFGNIAKLQGINNRITDGLSLLEHPENITRLNIAESARMLDSILSQGAATVSGTHEVTPNTLKQAIAKSKEYITGDPAKIDMQGFVDFYKNALNRIQGVNSKIIKDAQKQKIESATALAKMNPDGFATYAQSRGFNVEIDKKTGKIKATPVDEQQSADSRTPATPQMQTVMVRDRNTGQMIKALKDANGNLYKAE